MLISLLAISWLFHCPVNPYTSNSPLCRPQRPFSRNLLHSPLAPFLPPSFLNPNDPVGPGRWSSARSLRSSGGSDGGSSGGELNDEGSSEFDSVAPSLENIDVAKFLSTLEAQVGSNAAVPQTPESLQVMIAESISAGVDSGEMLQVVDIAGEDKGPFSKPPRTEQSNLT